MVAYVFEPILKRGEESGKMPGLEQNARVWFRNQAQKTSVSPQRMIKTDRDRLVKIPMLGQMYLFAYDPKHKQTLPYYDTFPLVIPFDSTRTAGKASQGAGFYGLNLHYLPPRLRARLMDAMYNYINNDKMDSTTRLKLSYRLLKRVATLKYYKPCVKHYLLSHMRSRFFYIEPKEWDIALFLPLDRFQKSNKNTIYKESIAKV